jgi:hypothetical protein
MLETRNATGCLYHRDPRTRDGARGATWIHQPGPVRSVTKDPDRLTVRDQCASAPNPVMVLAVHPGDHPRTIVASVLMSSVTRAGETDPSASSVPAPSSFSLKPFLSHPMPAPPPFPPPSWRGALMVSYSAPSVTMGRTSGLMASWSTMDRPSRAQPGRPRRIRATLSSNRRTQDAQTQKLTVRGGKGEPDRQSGG